MDVATFLLLAAEVAQHEHSQTPFLLIGGALAAFAVVVGVVGVLRPTLAGPFSSLTVGVGTLLVAGTMVAIVAVS